jgi:hypothetical protein
MVLVAGMRWSDAMQDRGRGSAPIQRTICDIATISPEPPG